MATPRLRALSIKGFRSYGGTEQILNLPSDIAVVWGPNSKGKTSLAEAFEFLLTGRIVRRELMASSQDEFADALRNAHLASDESVYVAARVISRDGSEHEIRRTLISDYSKRQGCVSRLEIDGIESAGADLGALGITLSQPPLEAPVLTQHTLGYIFSVRPQDRSTYFKTLLEVTDLDDFRGQVAALVDTLSAPADPLLTKLRTCLTVPALSNPLSTVLEAVPDHATLTHGLDEAAKALIESSDQVVPPTQEERLTAIERVLAERRTQTFPVNGFEGNGLVGWSPPSEDAWVSLDTYLREREKVDEKTRQLVALFDQALKLPAIAEIVQPLDCPLCGVEYALTAERVQLIRQHVENTTDFKKAETAVKAALAGLSTLAEALVTAGRTACPKFLRWPNPGRRQGGFTTSRIRELLADRAVELVEPWLTATRALARAESALRRAAEEAGEIIKAQTEDIATKLAPDEIRAAFGRLSTLRSALAASIDVYQDAAQPLQNTLSEVVDSQSGTAGWQDFLDIARQRERLHSVLIERAARNTVEKDLNEALKQIDRAKEKVLDDKFSDYSEAVQTWWERLRPDEPTFFTAVKPRPGARRTIDFKAGLSPQADRCTPKVRDVIAVFSQSQLHCLGLALFLARSQHEKVGFIVLDDPVLSSDQDYRVHFNRTVLTELLQIPIQVIVITQDHTTWKELETLYRHRAISIAQLYIDTPIQGTIVENTSDALLAKISRANSLARGGHPDSRKECGIQLRDAGERFCKELLVEVRRNNGEPTASLGEYEGKTLEWLCPRVDPFLNRDPSHCGKLEAFKSIVNRACHDNTPPGSEEMKHACGEIRHFLKEYLAR